MYLVAVYILAGVLGLCVGSFLNVVIYRVPAGIGLAKPNSHCPACKYELRWYDNIPVLSYLLLGGKCRSCKARISPRYVAVELANAALWLLCVLFWWEQSIALACIYALIFSVFLCVLCIDVAQKVIYDRFQVILLLLSVASVFFDQDYGWLSHVIGGAVGFVFFYLVSLAFERVAGEEGLGGGDIKLALVAGILLGWQRLLLALLVATLPAAVIMSIRKRGAQGEERQFPFAPFLIVGFTVAMFFGTQIVRWYLSLFGL